MTSNSRIGPTSAIRPSRAQPAPAKRQDAALPASPGRSTRTSTGTGTTAPDPGYPAAAAAPLPLVDGLLHGRPAQQARGAEDESPHNELVLAAVALEAHGRHVLVGGALADRQRLRQAEAPVALAARRRRGAALRAAGRPPPVFALAIGGDVLKVCTTQGVLIVARAVVVVWVGVAFGWGLVLRGGPRWGAACGGLGLDFYDCAVGEAGAFAESRCRYLCKCQVSSTGSSRGESQLMWCIDRWMHGLTYTLRPPGRRKRLGGV